MKVDSYQSQRKDETELFFVETRPIPLRRKYVVPETMNNTKDFCLLEG